MTIEKYDLKLVRLTAEKIELVRQWRNNPNVSMYMEYRDIITPEMQLNWFHKINNDENFFFIAVFNGDEVGLINIKDVDTKKQSGEGGIFIANQKYINSDVAFRMALCLNDFAFEKLDLKYINARILSDNPRAIKYNKALGYELQPNQDGVYNQHYILTKEAYFKKRELIKSLL